jgi:hypothetical protein
MRMIRREVEDKMERGKMGEVGYLGLIGTPRASAGSMPGTSFSASVHPTV